MRRRGEKKWLSQIGRFKVEHIPGRTFNAPIDESAPAKGLLHTIQGSLESGLAVFHVHFEPTFVVGRDRKGRVRIIQHVPLGMMAMALQNLSGGVETNRVCRVQIEIAGFSEKHPWLPDPGVCEALAALMHALLILEGIPLRHVDVRRDPRLWVRATGWVGHADAPENSHWDPGEIRYKRLFELAGVAPKVKLKAKPKKVQPATWVLVRQARKATPAPLCGGAVEAKSV